MPRSFLVGGDEGYTGPPESYYVKHQKSIQHMHQGIIPYMFDCWADPVVHLLLPKSSMGMRLTKQPKRRGLL